MDLGRLVRDLGLYCGIGVSAIPASPCEVLEHGRVQLARTDPQPVAVALGVGEYALCAGSSARTVCSTTFATTAPSSINDGTATPRPLPFDIGRRPVVQRPGPGGAGRAGGG